MASLISNCLECCLCDDIVVEGCARALVIYHAFEEKRICLKE